VVDLNYEGVLAFRSVGSIDFPVKVIHYLKSYYVVPDWSVNHDPGDEDDGEHKLIMKVKEV
jgi:uncharacterized protein YpmS